MVQPIVFGFVPEALVATAAFIRFRTTATGWLVGIAFGLRAIAALITGALTYVAGAHAQSLRPAYMIVRPLLDGFFVALLLLAAVGITLIPRSLERLSRD